MTLLQYLFYRQDPRRFQPLVDFILDEFHSVDFNGESSFDAVKVLSLFRSFYEGLDWKFSAWTDEVLDRFWSQIHSEHDEVSHLRYKHITVLMIAGCQVRAYIGEFLAFSGKIKVLFYIRTAASHFNNPSVETPTFCAHSRGLRKGVSNMLC